MNIAIIGTYDIAGGAARAMYRLHQGFQAIGENSYILSKIKKSDDLKVIHINPVFDPSKNPDIEKEKWIQTAYIDKGRSKLSNTLFTFPYPGYDLSQLEAIKKADVINLHWVAWFQSAETIAHLLSLDKPVVWTLHDMRSFTGGCHYSAGCEGFMNDCANCPQLENDYLQIPAKVLELQKKSYGKGKLTIVTPSRWLANEAERSAIFYDSEIKTIPYGLDLETFRPTDKKEARKMLGLDPDKQYLLFGAHGIFLSHKGFGLFVDAINKLSKLTHDVELLIFGLPSDEMNKIKLRFHYYNMIEDDSRLSLVYSASDLSIISSIEDNLPNIMLESIACGTPVIGFNIGGLPDLVKNGETGFLADPFDTDSMSSIIYETLSNHELMNYMSVASRMFALHNLDVKTQANRYGTLFSSLTKSENQSIKFDLQTKIDVDRVCRIDKTFNDLYLE